MPELQPFAPPVLPHPTLVTDKETDILRFALEAPGQVVLVTLVEVRGGAARALGAQMAVRDDGGFCGYVSGGCTEAAVAAEALQTLARGTDRFLKLGEGSPFFDIVLPCGGGLSLSLHILADREPVKVLLERLASRESAALIYDPKAQVLRVDSDGPTGWDDTVFRRAYRPQQRIALGGAGIEAEALHAVATAAGYGVVPIEPENLDEDTAVVILFHDIDREMPLIETALRGPSRYIGALGSARTHQRRCDALRASGYPEVQIARIRGPIGLFGPARDASTLALSIMADIAR